MALSGRDLLQFVGEEAPYADTRERAGALRGAGFVLDTPEHRQQLALDAANTASGQVSPFYSGAFGNLGDDFYSQFGINPQDYWDRAAGNIDVEALQRALESRGLTYGERRNPDQTATGGYFDPQGAQVGGTRTWDPEDHLSWGEFLAPVAMAVGAHFLLPGVGIPSSIGAAELPMYSTSELLAGFPSLPAAESAALAEAAGAGAAGAASMFPAGVGGDSAVGSSMSSLAGTGAPTAPSVAPLTAAELEASLAPLGQGLSPSMIPTLPSGALSATAPSLLSKLGSGAANLGTNFLTKLESGDPTAWLQAAGLVGAAGSAFGSKTAANQLSPAQLLAGMNGAQAFGAYNDWTDAQRPLVKSFTDRAARPFAWAPNPRGYAAGGDVGAGCACGALRSESGGYAAGGGSGQADDIPARLSAGEYVFDADTVSSLGDGNNAAGARVLDEFRRRLRAHKRAAPADRVPPRAHTPEHYLPKGA